MLFIDLFKSRRRLVNPLGCLFRVCATGHKPESLPQ
jgi:hypothetical protein